MTAKASPRPYPSADASKDMQRPTEDKACTHTLPSDIHSVALQIGLSHLAGYEAETRCLGTGWGPMFLYGV